MSINSQIARIALFVFFFLYVGSSLGSGSAIQSQPKENPPNVIVIMLSGVRNIESLKDPYHQYIPNLWKMFKEGTVYNNLIDLNYEFHIPAFNAVTTGKRYPINCKIFAPSLLQYVKKRYALQANKVWSIGHWWYDECAFETKDYPRETFPSQISISDMALSPEVQKLLTRQEAASFNNFHILLTQVTKTAFEYLTWDSFSEALYGLFKKVVKVFKPTMVFYMMEDADSGHYDSFGHYVLGLKRCDERIFEIWQVVLNDPHYRDNTYFFVCIDHERNEYYMQHSENSRDNPSRVWMYVFGPGVKKGRIIGRSVYHADVFATIARLMDVKIHETKGEVLSDCFEPMVLRKNLP